MNATVEEKIEVKVEKNTSFLEGVNEQEFMNINKYFPRLEEKDFSHVSFKLLREYGYYKNGEIRRYFLVELLNQARELVKESTECLGSVEPYLFHEIEIPDDKIGMILICQNIDGKTSIKLPSEVLKN